MNKLLTLTILFFAINIYSQNGSPTCDAAEPLCSDNTGVKIFPNVTNQADQGEYGCLGSTTNATWFYIKVGQTGELKFNIVQNTRFDVNGNPIGTPLDVDYIAWGPFNDPNRGCSSLATNWRKKAARQFWRPLQNAAPSSSCQPAPQKSAAPYR